MKLGVISHLSQGVSRHISHELLANLLSPQLDFSRGLELKLE